jgi:hypothetical protein
LKWLLGVKMTLDLKRLSLADVRLIFTEMEADLEAQFLELLELRERVREAELSAHLQNKTRARSRASPSRKVDVSFSL